MKIKDKKSFLYAFAVGGLSAEAFGSIWVAIAVSFLVIGAIQFLTYLWEQE